jgi:hypothetical protein
VLNAGAGILGLAVQVAAFWLIYLMVAPTRGRSRALFFAAVVALNGYALVLLGFATVGIPWQATNVIIGVGVGAVFATRGVRARAWRTPQSFLHWLAASIPAAAIVIALLGIQTLAVVLLPELSIDGQLYHGPVLAQLLNTGTLWGWQSPNQYMYYSDLTMLGGVNLATFTGAAVFDNGLQIPHLLLLLLALNVLLLSRFDRAWIRMSFAALIVAAPVIWLQPRILYVDVAYGAAVATIIVLIVTSRRFDGLEMVVAGISAAAILATKPTGILTSALLIAVWIVVAAWRRRKEGRPLGRAVWPVVLGAAIPMFFGLGFYLRNLISFGNPVYPVQASFGPLHLRGIVDLSVFASGDRGSGLFDPTRLISFFASLGTGMVNGVAKPDYDPRAGGYGYVTLAVIAVAVGILFAQAIVAVVARHRGAIAIRPVWRSQVAVVVLSAAVLVIQPSTFDSRYVIGPTSVIFAAILMTSIFTAPRLIDVVAAGCALAIAATQIVWTEANAYPGLHIAKELRALTDRAQPVTPGNPWGRSDSVAWLPTTECTTVALQTNGGVAAWGMTEQSQLATLPYGLYGEHLCNLVEPVQLVAIETGAASTDPVPTADFLVLYTQDLARWEQLYPELSDCLQEVTSVASSEGYPQAVTVFASSCR